MKLQIKNNTYKASNVTLRISPDLTKIEAFSYGWWQFVATDLVGNVIFNSSRYSSSTSGHQSNVRSKLQQLGVNIAINLTHTKAGIGRNIQAILTDEILTIKEAIVEIQAQMNKKGTRKSKNELRKDQIQKLTYRIQDLERYRDEYIDKKLIPIKKEPASQYAQVTCNTYQSYFLKPNGVLKRNEFQEFTHAIKHYKVAPQSLARLKALFDLKDVNAVLPVLLYEFSDDLENQIPDIDSNSYSQLKSWLKRNEISKDTLNIFALDKIHTYLTSKTNKPDQGDKQPSQAVLFPIHPVLESLRNTEGLTLLDTAQKLRAEGRKQSHCIGGKDYVEQCKEGAQALNYKGYTFFLDSKLQLKQTNGKHNSVTPYSLISELETLISRESKNV